MVVGPAESPWRNLSIEAPDDPPTPVARPRAYLVVRELLVQDDLAEPLGIARHALAVHVGVLRVVGAREHHDLGPHRRRQLGELLRAALRLRVREHVREAHERGDLPGALLARLTLPVG